MDSTQKLPGKKDSQLNLDTKVPTVFLSFCTSLLLTVIMHIFRWVPQSHGGAEAKKETLFVPKIMFFEFFLGLDAKEEIWEN